VFSISLITVSGEKKEPAQSDNCSGNKGLTIWDFENSVSPANQASAEYEVIFNSILSWGGYA
jgi:hypothetical protein